MVGLWGHAQRGAGGGDLTILDRMILEERRAVARATGVSVADLEERANLESALAMSSGETQSPALEEELCELRPILDDDFDDDDGVDDFGEEERWPEEGNVKGGGSKRLETDLGAFRDVPDDLFERILISLTPEASTRCAATSRDWARLATSESVCEALCRRSFGARSQFRPERWSGWRGMLARRSRVRVGGMYALRSSKWRSVRQEDMFLPSDLKGCFHLEVVWWRVFRFFDDGRVAYVLLNQPPVEKNPLTTAATLLDKPEPFFLTKTKKHHKERSYLGSYVLKRRELLVDVELPHAHMHFAFRLDHGARGHFAKLQLLQHRQSEPDGRFPIDHNLPELADFKFNQVRKWA